VGNQLRDMGLVQGRVRWVLGGILVYCASRLSGCRLAAMFHGSISSMRLMG
jgi:hypothetical protein